MIWQPYSTWQSRRSLSRCGLLDHILCKWQLVRHYLEWVWVILGGSDIILGGWGWVGVYEALFWVGGGGQGIMLGKWRWVGIVCMPSFCWGRGWTSYQIFKKEELDRTLVFREGCWERGGDFIQRGLQFFDKR